MYQERCHGNLLLALPKGALATIPLTTTPFLHSSLSLVPPLKNGADSDYRDENAHGDKPEPHQISKIKLLLALKTYRVQVDILSVAMVVSVIILLGVVLFELVLLSFLLFGLLLLLDLLLLVDIALLGEGPFHRHLDGDHLSRRGIEAHALQLCTGTPDLHPRRPWECGSRAETSLGTTIRVVGMRRRDVGRHSPVPVREFVAGLRRIVAVHV